MFRRGKWVFVATIFFLQSLVIQSEPGFFPIGHPKVPAIIGEKADSIYTIYIVFEQLGYLPKNQIPTQRQYLQTSVTGHLQTWRYLELELFAGEPSIPIFNVAVGTAFLLGNRRTLVTARQNFDIAGVFPQPYFAAPNYQSAMLAVENMIPPIVVTDRDGKVVLNTFVEDPRPNISFRFCGHPHYCQQMGTPFESMEISTAREMTDVLVMTLPQDLPGNPLEIRDRPLGVNEQVYVVGYPDETVGRNSFKDAVDSEGKGLRVSLGKTLTPIDAYREALLRLNNRRPDIVSAYLSQQIFTDADAANSMSGSPMLVQDGKVAGVYTAHFPDRADLRRRFYEEGGRGVGHRFLERILGCP